MTDKEMAEEYVKANVHYEIAKRENGAEYAKEVSSVTIEQAFLAGLAVGKDINVSTKWHDLRKNPDDLPKEEGLFVVYWSLGKIDGYMVINGFKNPHKDIVKWCEIPTFKELDK